MTLAKEQERLSRILPHRFGLGQSLSLQAAILRHRSDWQGAGELYGQAESLYRSIGNSAGYLASLINHAAILLAHDWSGALALLRIAEPVVRELGQLKAFAANLMSQAIALRKGGRHGEAMALLRSCEGFWRELGDERMLGECLGNQANILWDQGNAEAALRTYKQAEAIARRVGDDESVATSLLNMARLIDEDLHSPDRALPLAEEGLRVARAAGLADHEQELGLLVDSLRRRASERPRAPSWWQRLRKIGKSDE
jgi:tetratricopeptide (TPR) repeat protein